MSLISPWRKEPQDVAVKNLIKRCRAYHAIISDFRGNYALNMAILFWRGTLAQLSAMQTAKSLNIDTDYHDSMQSLLKHIAWKGIQLDIADTQSISDLLEFMEDGATPVSELNHDAP